MFGRSERAAPKMSFCPHSPLSKPQHFTMMYGEERVGKKECHDVGRHRRNESNIPLESKPKNPV